MALVRLIYFRFYGNLHPPFLCFFHAFIYGQIFFHVAKIRTKTSRLLHLRALACGPSPNGPSPSGPSSAGPRRRALAGRALAGGPSLAGPRLAGTRLAGPRPAGPRLAGPRLRALARGPSPAGPRPRALANPSSSHPAKTVDFDKILAARRSRFKWVAHHLLLMVGSPAGPRLRALACGPSPAGPRLAGPRLRALACGLSPAGPHLRALA